MTTFIKELDKLLAKHDGYSYEEYIGKTGGHNHSQNQHVIEFKQQLLNLVSERIIGEDIQTSSLEIQPTPDDYMKVGYNDAKFHARNRLYEGTKENK